MRKHFTGIALFIFIVGISGFVANLFNEIPKPEVFEVQNTVPVYESKKKCSKKYRGKEQPKVEMLQAVYSEKTKRFYFEGSINNPSVSDSNRVKLHFFIKDGEKTQFISTDVISLREADNFEDSLYQRGYFQFDSLKKLKSHENLYVIPEFFIPVDRKELIDKIPVFDEGKATAVLVADL